MSKEYLLGVVATFDETTGFWAFEPNFLGGDGPFMEHDHEVYNNETDEWECAHMTAEDGTVERTNYLLLEEAVQIVEGRLRNYEPITNIREMRP